MKVAFLILAHDQPALCARLADRLLQQGADVCLHADARSGAAFIRDFDRALDAEPARVLRAKREQVDWGQWSMVQATLNGLEAIAGLETPPDYVYLVSGADYPIRPLDELVSFLERNRGREFIESVNARTQRWVTQGLQEDRWRYRHWISWKTHPALFDLQLRVQRFLGLRRSFPQGLQPHMGSQWWTLTWPTCAAILEAAREPALQRFFRTTWVPDELLFQTLVRKVVDRSDRIDSRHLTLYRFDRNGVPLVFHDDHVDLLAGQPYFFARKVSPRAEKLRDALDKVACDSAGQRTPALTAKTMPLPEYDRHLAAHAQGFSGVRRMLRPDPGRPGLGDLGWNARPYVVVIGDNTGTLEIARKLLKEQPGVVCHGELMAADAVHLAEGSHYHGGYRPTDTAIRDQSPTSLVADLVNDAAGSIVAYLLRPGQANVPVTRQDKPEDVDITAIHASDPNAHLLIIVPPADPGAGPGQAGDPYQRLEQRTRGDRARQQLLAVADLARQTGVPHQVVALESTGGAQPLAESMTAFITGITEARQARN